MTGKTRIMYYAVLLVFSILGLPTAKGLMLGIDLVAILISGIGIYSYIAVPFWADDEDPDERTEEEAEEERKKAELQHEPYLYVSVWRGIYKSNTFGMWLVTLAMRIVFAGLIALIIFMAVWPLVRGLLGR